MKFDRVIRLDDLSGGINNVESPDAIEDNECEDLINVDFIGTKTPQTRRGTIRASNSAALESGRCTSIHHFPRSDGTEDTLCTYYDSGSDKQEIRKMVAGIWDSATGLITPSGGGNIAGNIYWQWANFNDIAIGVNGISGTNNPVMFTGTGNASALSGAGGYTGTIAKGKYITVFGGRIWIAPHGTAENTIISSKVGSHTNWDTTATGAADAFIANVGGVKDGDYITGIYPHRGRLIIFKRRSIWVLYAGSSQTANVDINTDKTMYSIKLITKNVGCRSGYTIQAVMNDLIFLSDSGFMQLSVVEESGDFAVSQVLSRKIREIKESQADDVDTFGSCVDEEFSVYMCSMHVPAISGGIGSTSTNNVTYCMNFANPQRPTWYKWTSEGIGATLATVVEHNKKRVYIGGYGHINKVAEVSLTSFHDNDDSLVAGTTETFYETTVKTKDFPFGSPLEMKLLNYWRLYIYILTTDCDLNIDYIMNGELTELTERTSELFSGLTAAGTLVSPKIVRRFSPRRGTSIQFHLYSETKDQAFAFRELYMDGAIIGRARVSRV